MTVFHFLHILNIIRLVAIGMQDDHLQEIIKKKFRKQPRPFRVPGKADKNYCKTPVGRTVAHSTRGREVIPLKRLPVHRI